MDSCEASGDIDAIFLTFYDEVLYIYDLLSDCGFIAGYRQGCKSYVTSLSRIKWIKEMPDKQIVCMSKVVDGYTAANALLNP